MKHINKIKSLVKSDCASYFTEQSFINHYCCMVDGACVFSRDIEKPRCKYFEQTVLPLGNDLHKLYHEEHKLGGNFSKPLKSNSKCEKCKNEFEAKSNRQVYCERCRKIVKREQARISMQNKRKNAQDVNR